MGAPLVKGIVLNKTTFQGRIAEDPQISEDAAWVKLNTVIAEQSGGSFEEALQPVPLLITDKKKIEVARKYFRVGKQIYVEGYYKSWEYDGSEVHAFVVSQIRLGPDENYKPGGQKSGGPPLPPR